MSAEPLLTVVVHRLLLKLFLLCLILTKLCMNARRARSCKVTEVILTICINDASAVKMADKTPLSCCGREALVYIVTYLYGDDS